MTTPRRSGRKTMGIRKGTVVPAVKGGAQEAVAGPVETPAPSVKAPAKPINIAAETDSFPQETPEAQTFSWGEVAQRGEGHEPGANKLSVSERTRQRLGIRSDEAVTYATDTMHGGISSFSMDDNVGRLLDAVPEARLVLDPKTKQPVRVGHNVLIAYPKAIAEAHQAEVDQMDREMAEKARTHNLPGDMSRLTHEDREAMSEHSHTYLRHIGVGSEVFSPTAGVSYRAVVAHKTVDEIRAEQDRYRQGGRRPNAADAEAADNRARQERESTGRRTNWAGFKPGQ